jgi:hypothetical protein
VAFEVLHTLNGQTKGRERFLALKLDMTKAYDRIEWDFLEAAMKMIGSMADGFLCISLVST